MYSTNAEDTDRGALADDDPPRQEYLRDYHRPDLIHQRIYNPERYQAMLADMRQGAERQRLERQLAARRLLTHQSTHTDSGGAN